MAKKKNLTWEDLDWELIKRPMSMANRKVFAAAALKDFRVFAKLCGAMPWDWAIPGSGHNLIADAVCSKDRGPDGVIRIHVEAPRGGGKSATWQTHAAWRMVRSAFSYPDEEYKDGSIIIMYCCESAKKVADVGALIHTMLSDKDSGVVRVFGQLVSPEASTTKFTLLKRKVPNPQPTFTIGAPRKSTSGAHPHLLYVDDVETDKSCNTMTLILQTRKWFDELQAQINPRGEIRVTGTRYEDNDLYGHITRQEGVGWHVVILTIKNATFTLLPEEVIAGKKATMDPKKFAMSYHNDPWLTEFQTFPRETIRYLKMKEEGKENQYTNMPKYILTDFGASDKNDACETAFWVVGKDDIKKAENVYCFDLMHGKWQPSETKKRLAALFGKWHPKWFTVEQRAMNAWVREAIQAAAREYQITMPDRKAAAGNYSKEDHVRRLEPRFRAGRIWFMDTMPQSEIRQRRTTGGVNRVIGHLVEALMKWPKGRLKDVLDALAYVECMDEHGAPLVPRMRKKKAEGWVPHPNKPKNPWAMGGFKRRGREDGGWNRS